MANQRKAGKVQVSFWVDLEDRKTLKEAAAARGLTVTEWVLSHVQKQAHKAPKKGKKP